MKIHDVIPSSMTRFRSNCLAQAWRHWREEGAEIYMVLPWDFARGLHFYWKSDGRFFDFCGKVRGNLLARIFLWFPGQIRELAPNHEIVLKGKRVL